MKFVTIKESHFQTDLIVLKSRLESEGIQCLLKNELTSQILNYVPSFLVELQVPDTDLHRVKEIMIETGDLKSEDLKDVCSDCGSENIKMKLSILKRIQLFFAVLGVLLFNGLPVDKLFRKAKHVCTDCGAEVTF